MLMSRFIACIVAAGTMAFGTGLVSGLDYPTKPVRIITSGVGSGADLLVRLIAQAISGPLGQPVVVENRGGLIGIETVAKAPPDGYTVLLQGNVIWLLPLMQDVSYNPARDLSPVTLAGKTPQVIVVHPSLPATSIKELIALVKARPGEFNYAAAAPGNLSHLAGELFNAMAGVSMVRVTYKSAGATLAALMGREVQVSFPVAGAALPHLKSGKLKALAVASAQPSVLAPGLPTAAVSGLPGYEAETIFGMFVPAGTPPAIIDRLNKEIARFLDTADARERMLKAGIEVRGTSTEQAAARIKSDLRLWGKVIKEAGIRVGQ
ncbi:MAG: tripartite tricarboxylate transporter substrate binding protein [Betaproteobacteria bacterium]|nr:tripartite tricarboxylate transporter substrate binding protein [Betaproteobacteria bacterium]